MTESMDSPPATHPGEGDGPYPGEYQTYMPNVPIKGNTEDDDGIALDEMFEAMDVGPQVYGIPDAPRERLPIPKSSRIITRSLPLQEGVPLMFLAPDPRRDHLTIVIHGNARIRFAGEKSDVYGAGMLLGGGEDGVPNTLAATYDFPGYKGAVWLLDSFGSDPADVVNVWAITE